MKVRSNIKLTKVLLISTFYFFIINSILGQDTFEIKGTEKKTEKETGKKISFSHQFCFGPQWINWAYDDYYDRAAVSYLRQGYQGFYKFVIGRDQSLMKFAFTLNGAYMNGEGHFSSYESFYRDSYRGKFENYWGDINPCIYFSFGKRRNLLLGGGPFFGKLLYTENDIVHTVREEPIGAPPTTTTTKDDKILNRSRGGATLEIQQKIIIKDKLGILAGLKLFLTTTDGFTGFLVPGTNPYIGISF